MRTLRPIALAALTMLAVASATPAVAADKCTKTIAAEIKKVAISNFKAAIKGKAPKSLNTAKITKACASGPPAGYQGCPGIGACAADTKKDIASYQACLACLATQTGKDVDRRTTPGTCGNPPTKDAGEECDANAPCATGTCGQPGTVFQCTCSKCGDNVVQAGLGETCDGTSGCRGPGSANECTSCGDGKVDSAAGETCDGTAGCRAPSTPGECTKCGDNVVDANLGETCDGGPGCRADCTKCGDGLINGDEACDPQASPNGCGGGGCSDTCECQCGNGTIDAGEDCDPANIADSCGGGFVCGSSGAVACKCSGPCSDFKSFEFTLTPGASSCAGQCSLAASRTCFTDNGCAQEAAGDAGTCNGKYCEFSNGFCTTNADCQTNVGEQCKTYLPPSAGQSSGTITYNDSSTGNLGKGCLYFGGGNNRNTPPAPIPDGAVVPFDTVCQGTAHFLTAKAGNPAACTLGVTSAKHCIDGTLDTGQPKVCTVDTDCNISTSAGRCAPDAQCYFGPPLPIAGGSAPTCLLNVYANDANGTIDPATGESNIQIELFTRIFLPPIPNNRCFNGSPGTGNGLCQSDADCNNAVGSCRPSSPCPICVSNICIGGKNHGQTCTPVGSVGTTLDCPVDPTEAGYLSTLAVTLGPLTTGTSTKTADANGNFCTPQDAQGPGAFGQGSVQGNLKVTQISESGTLPGDLRDGNDHAGVLGYTFCIPLTNSFVDAIASLPGPGAVGLAGNFHLTPQTP